LAHAYTPGLRVSAFAVVRRERRLPLRGKVLVESGDRVEPGTVVARTDLPGNVQTVNLAARLASDPARVLDTLIVPVGSSVTKGQPLARAKSLFGLMTQTVEAPADGTIESVSHVTGQLILREPPLPVEVTAYVKGVVAEVMPEEGVVVESRGAFLQGIFGVGGETSGPVAIAVDSPERELSIDRLKPEHRGAVVVGGCGVSYEALMHARSLGVAAVVVAGFDDGDLRRLLGRDLGVAITGSEELGLTLVLTEGFGRIPMAERAWRLLLEAQGQVASVSGATQIRAGVMRPEILIPREQGAAAEDDEARYGTALDIGSTLRVIREPHFGRIGRVVDLPAELLALDSEARVRVLVVEFLDDHSRATIPRANVELISA
jgi:biotin carboxyl carrier protein